MPEPPISVVTRMAHAALAHLARREDVDLLHIKGAAIDRSLATPRRTGTDADVLVRPTHLPRFLAALRARGWEVHTDFATGSPFGHATTLAHPVWRHADVHRTFPGIRLDPEGAFDLMWRSRSSRAIAGTECAVPDLTAQRLILVLNAARRGTYARTDLEAAWTSASAEERRDLLGLVDELDARVAFAAATGDLERFRDDKSYDLWRITTEGGTRTGEWVARIRAAPTRRDALRLALAAPLVNTDHLAVRLGRRPTRSEIALEFVHRLGRGATEVARALTQRLRTRRT